MTAAAVVSPTVAIWFDRNILLGEREWPQNVHLQVIGADGNVLKVSRGDDWLLEAEVTEGSRRIPEEAWLEIRGETQQQRMESAGRRFQLPMAPASQPFEFRVVSGRAFSEWTRLTLVDRPTVDEVTLIAIPPAYLKQPPVELSAKAGPYQLLKGSSLRVSGRASKPLSTATLAHGRASVSMAMQPDATFQAEIGPADLKEGDYSISVTDTESVRQPGFEQPAPLTSRTPTSFRMKLVADQPPDVQAKLVGISGVVTSRAAIPIEGRLSDDHALASARLQRRHRLDEADSDVAAEIDLAAALRPGDRNVDLTWSFDLAPLSLPAGVSVSFTIEAQDFNDLTGPGIGRSATFVVRVVTDEEFRANLLAREREQATELEKRLKQQQDLLTETRALLAGSSQATELGDDERRRLAQIRKQQKTIGEEAGRIARRFEDMLAEIRNNRLEDAGPTPLQSRLKDGIAAPLWKVSTGDVERALSELDGATKSLSDPLRRNQHVTETSNAQERVIAGFQDVLSRMEQSQGFQEAVNRLLEVQRAQEEVLKQTEREKQEAIRKLLENKSTTVP
jgi:hypothetical protein